MYSAMFRPQSTPVSGRITVMLTAVLLLVAACTAESTDDAGSTSPGDSPTSVDSGDGVGRQVTVAIESLSTERWAPHRADGFETAVQFIIGDTLLRVDPETREIGPGLVTEWTNLDDGRTWEFKLREGVQFHKGYGELTTEDVRFTWETFLLEDALHSRTGTYRDAIDGDIANFEIVDEYTFRTHASVPNLTLIDELHDGKDVMVIHSKAHADEVGFEQAFDEPVGTGPFEFVSHEEGASVTFMAVEDHWRHPPEFDTLELRIVPEPAARIAQLQTGESDLAPIPLPLIPEAEAAGLQVVSVPDTSISNIYFGGMYPDMPEKHDPDAPWIQDDNPEQGLAIRKALSYAIDRQSIVDNLQFGLGEVVAAPIVYFPGYPMTDPAWEPDPYDPEQARELLAEGGYPDGFEVSFPVYEQAGRPSSADIAQAVASWWTEIGLTVNIVPMDASPTWDGYVDNRDTIGWIFQWAQSFSDECAGRLSDFTIDQDKAEFHYLMINEYLPGLQTLPTREERMAHCRELGEHFRADYAALGLVTMETPYATSSDVEGWFPINATGELRNVEYLRVVGE